MAETSTFSALVDSAIARSQRRDRVADLVSYARATIRECQVKAFFEQDMIEDSLTVTTTPFEWTRPQRFRAMLAAKPQSTITRHGETVYFKNKPPGQPIRGVDYFLYLSGNTFIFSGENLSIGQIIDVSYFTYARNFAYYATADRPATFDDITETWSYHATYTGTPELNAQGEELVSNWLLMHWFDLLLEGTLAKLFNAIGDERSKSTFALYKSMQKDLLSGERVILLNDKPDLNG